MRRSGSCITADAGGNSFIGQLHAGGRRLGLEANIRNPLAETVVMRMFLEYFDTPIDFATNFYIRRSVKLGEVPDVRLPKRHFHFLDNHDMDRILFAAKGNHALVLDTLRWLVKNGGELVF